MSMNNLHNVQMYFTTCSQMFDIVYVQTKRSSVIYTG